MEHYYQAYKADSAQGFQHVLSAPTPAEAKRRGRKVGMRPQFEDDKRMIMLNGVLAKFTQHPELRHQLALTGRHELAEVNTWGDRYWGMVSASAGLEGENWLGRILMMARELLS